MKIDQNLGPNVASAILALLGELSLEHSDSNSNRVVVICIFRDLY